MVNAKTVRALHSERKKMWDASMQNHKKYIDPQTGLFASDYVEQRNCPVCGENGESEKVFKKSGGEYHICRSCEMIFLNPVFKDEFLNEYYSQNHDVQSAIVENDSEFYISLYSKGLNQITASLGRKGRILDIGCSSGVFLGHARSQGWETVGVELNQKEAEYCRNKGHQVFSCSIDSPDLKEQIGIVDVITMWDVFEHIKNGIQLFQNLRSILSSDGIVFLQVPTCNSLASKVLQEKCNMFDGLEHVNLYSRLSLERLCSFCGYNMRSFSTVISEVGVMNNYLQYEDPYLGSTENKNLLLGRISAEAILGADLGYKIQTVLQKDHVN